MFNPAKLVYGDGKNAHISVEGKIEHSRPFQFKLLFQRKCVFQELVGYFPLIQVCLTKLPKEAAPAGGGSSMAVHLEPLV